MSPSSFVGSQPPSVLPHVDASATEPIGRLTDEQHVQLAAGNQNLDRCTSNSNPKDYIVTDSRATSTDTIVIGSSQQKLVPISYYHEPLISEVLPHPKLIKRATIQNPPKILSDDARLLEVRRQSHPQGADQEREIMKRLALDTPSRGQSLVNESCHPTPSPFAGSATRPPVMNSFDEYSTSTSHTHQHRHVALPGHSGSSEPQRCSQPFYDYSLELHAEERPFQPLSHKNANQYNKNGNFNPANTFISPETRALHTKAFGNDTVAPNHCSSPSSHQLDVVATGDVNYIHNQQTMCSLPSGNSGMRVSKPFDSRYPTSGMVRTSPWLSQTSLNSPIDETMENIDERQVYVGGLSADTTPESLKELFGSFGPVLSASQMCHRQDYIYAFVTCVQAEQCRGNNANNEIPVFKTQEMPPKLYKAYIAETMVSVD